MSKEQESRSTDAPRVDDSEPADTPLHFVVVHDHNGQQTLDVIDGTLEQTYRMQNTFTTTLFLALCRSRGLLPYRRARQRDNTVCVRTTLSEHDKLWADFADLAGQLQMQLAEVAHTFMHRHIKRRPR